MEKCSESNTPYGTIIIIAGRRVVMVARVYGRITSRQCVCINRIVFARSRRRRSNPFPYFCLNVFFMEYGTLRLLAMTAGH